MEKTYGVSYLQSLYLVSVAIFAAYKYSIVYLQKWSLLLSPKLVKLALNNSKTEFTGLCLVINIRVRTRHWDERIFSEFVNSIDKVRLFHINE